MKNTQCQHCEKKLIEAIDIDMDLNIMYCPNCENLGGDLEW